MHTSHLNRPTQHNGTMHSRILRPCLAAGKSPEPILAFLIPSTQCPRKAPAAQFSTSPTRCKSDNNQIRGLSAVRATGLRKGRKSEWTKIWAKSPGEIPRPKPIKQKVTGTPDHGLWDFFKDQKLLTTPLEESRHGNLLIYGFSLFQADPILRPGLDNWRVAKPHLRDTASIVVDMRKGAQPPSDRED